MSETSSPDSASPDTSPEQIVEQRQLIRAIARDAEAKRSRGLAITLVVLAVGVAAIAAGRSRPPREYARLSALLLEGVFLLVAFVTAQVCAGRLVQGRRTLSGYRPAMRGRGGHRGEGRGWRPVGWLLTLVPVAAFVIVLLACHVELRNVTEGLQVYATERSDVMAAVWAITGGTVALALVTVLLSWMTRRLARPAVVPPDGVQSETQTLPARSAETSRRTAPVETSRGADPEAGTGPRELESDRRQEAAKKPLVLAFSGGGLRSASFCFGGFNAVQAQPAITNVDAMVAVSGGGYAASAISLTRSFAGDAVPPNAPAPPKPLPPITDVYSATSPELAYLRRNSRYIFQPPWRTVSGLWQLVGGALINLFLVVMALRFFAWLLGWYWSAVGVVDGLDTDRPHLNLSTPDRWQWYASTFLWIAAVAVIAVLLFLQILRRGSDVKAPSSALWARSLATTSHVLLAALAAMVLLPAIVVGLSRMAYGNDPAPLVAKTIVSLGLTRESACADAIGRSADSAHASTVRSGQLSQRTQSASYGGCGVSGSLTYVPGQADTYDRGRAIAAVGGAPSKQGVSGQLVSVFLVVAAALGSLRRSFTSVSKSAAGRLAAVRRWLLLRLPIAAVGLLAVWLVALWTYQYTVSGPTQSLVVPALLIMFAIVVQLVNPNLTSVHEFYRERLSSAFAVGRDNADQRVARNLPYSVAYKLSRLEPAPELVLCSTANINDQRVVPTRRFGVPMTFSSTLVRLESDGLVPGLGYQRTADVEDDPRGPLLTVMAASAMSGAAVSPMMGRMGGKVAPFRLLLTLFNVRLGVWVMNPRWPLGEPPAPGWAPMATQPRFHQLFSEAFGSTTVDDRWIYLTDGGHLDNLGLVEAVRRLPDRVLAMSASNDAPGSWQDVGAAVSVLRADLDIDLRVVGRDEQDTWMRLKAVRPDGNGEIDVLVVRASLTTADWPLAGVKANGSYPPVDQRMPIDIRSFATRDATFPRTSTGRQDFGDLEFESYRRLGQYLVDRALLANADFLAGSGPIDLAGVEPTAGGTQADGQRAAEQHQAG
ncbi:MAG: hypothetical protein ACJ71T_08995 [Actinomycetales bacterium]